MNYSDNVKMKGSVTLTLISDTGEIKEVRKVPNLVVNTGKEYIASRMADNDPVPTISHMAIGTDASSPNGTSPNLLDTTLTAENARVALTSPPGFTSAGFVLTATATFPSGTGQGGIVEAGLFNDDPGGDMLCRTIFDVINKGAADTLSIEWKVEVISV